MIPPSQRILPASGSVDANPAIVSAGPDASFAATQNGASGSVNIDAGGIAGTMGLTADLLLSATGGAGPTAAEVLLSPNSASLQSVGAAGVASVAGGLVASIGAPTVGVNGGALVEVTGPSVSIGDIGATVGFRGIAPVASPAAPTTPTQAVPVIANPTFDADFATWKLQVENAVAAIRTALVDQGLSI